MKSPEFIVIYDTYCGWCYGAAPVFDALVKTGADVEVLHRHLFQGSRAYRMSAGKGDLVLAADKRISELTGQQFSQRYIDNVVLSDTELLESKFTAQAAALVHAQGPEKEFAVRERLETARYIDGVSAGDRDAVVLALVDEGIPVEDAELIGTPELEAKAAVNSLRAQELMESVESNGVPTILKATDSGYQIVDHAAYYDKPNRIAEWLPQTNEQTQASSSR